jgi:hypothetical protein
LYFTFLSSIIYIIKEFVQPKVSLNNREFLIWKERDRGRRSDRRAGGQADMARFGRDRADNKNPKQSCVVLNICISSNLFMCCLYGIKLLGDPKV